MAFEWDYGKARINLAKHRVSFDEAASAFGDAPRTFFDETHSVGETRFSVIGWSDRGRLLTVAVTFRGDDFRIINAPPATKAEAKKYGQA